jgi:hypothetical protein
MGTKGQARVDDGARKGRVDAVRSKSPSHDVVVTSGLPCRNLQCQLLLGQEILSLPVSLSAFPKVSHQALTSSTLSSTA